MAFGRGGNPSVSRADSSPCRGAKGDGLRQGRQPLRFASEPPPLDRGGNDSSPCRGANAMTYLRHVSGAKRTSMGKISRRPRNMSKHRTALLIILSPETPMVKVFESMP